MDEKIRISNRMIEKVLSVNCEELNKIDLSEFKGVQHWFNLEAGQEHYRLLAYISTLCIETTLLDIGSFKGDSARALSYNKSNIVLSYDLEPQPEIKKINLPNVLFKVENVLCKTTLIFSAPFILLDTFHNGDFEQEFMDKLIEIDYHGLVMFDDIHLNRQMQTFWDGIDHVKWDLTHIGHHTGTGIVKL